MTTLRLAILGCALALVGADLAKPLVVDDAAFVQYARQIAEHPGDPYGFEIFWESAPQPAVEVLAPPVFLYWWAAGLRLFGDEPLAWKLWTLPFALLLCASLAALLRRVAPGAATPMLCAIALSPPLLPSMNLMLDLPALALALAGLALALRACERDQLWLAVAAGCVAGLALQTKYPALLPLVAGIAHAGWSGRPRVAIALGASAALPFVGFELWLLARQGVSHFAMAVLQVRAIEGLPAQHWIGALLGLLGSSSTGLALLSWLALGASRRVVVLASGAVAAGVLAIALLPGAPVGGEEALLAVWRPEMWIFLPQGLFALAGLLGLAWRTGRRIREAGDGGDAKDPSGAACDRFALLWLGIELVGFFVLSPYPALRRLIGLQVAFGVLIARSLERRGRHGLLVPLAAFGAALGLLFAVSDATDARTREDVLERAIARLDAEPWLRADATRWYVGHWGFQFQAERHGLRPIVPGVSRLAPGDAVLVPSGVYRQAFRVPGERLVTIETLAGRNPWPWSTLPWAYAGYPPLRAQPDAQIRVRIGRVVAPARAR